MQPKCRQEEQAAEIYLVLLQISTNIDVHTARCLDWQHRPWQHTAILPVCSRQYRLFFWVMKGLCKALISFSKWKTKQDKKLPDDVVEMPWAFDVPSFVLLLSRRAVTASGYMSFCQVCARFHGSYSSSFQSNLGACTIHQKVVKDFHWKQPGSLTYIAAITAKFKATFPHSSPGYTLLPVLASHIHGLMKF